MQLLSNYQQKSKNYMQNIKLTLLMKHVINIEELKSRYLQARWQFLFSCLCSVGPSHFRICYARRNIAYCIGILRETFIVQNSHEIKVFVSLLVVTVLSFYHLLCLIYYYYRSLRIILYFTASFQVLQKHHGCLHWFG